MRFRDATDIFVGDMKAYGRMNSRHTEARYRHVLDRLGEQVGNRDPRTVNRDDIKRCLRNWPYPGSRNQAHSIFVRFFDYACEEGWRKDNPARQTARAKPQPINRYRLTIDETTRMLNACRTVREKRAIYLGICAGLRNAELCGMRGEHFQRTGFVWVSADIAKGGRERWVPVLPDLAPVWWEIRQNVPIDSYVLPARRVANPGVNTELHTIANRSLSSNGLRHIVSEVATRAGITAHITPHCLRHAFGDHIARYAGIKVAQSMLGHSSVGTTEIYTGKATLDEIRQAVDGLSFGAPAFDEKTASLGYLLTRLKGDLAPVARSLGLPTTEQGASA